MRRSRSPLLVVVVVMTATLLAGCGSTADPQRSSAPAATSTATSTAPASATASAAQSYVALGDSYSAAPGVPTTTIADGCFRSDHDYPHLLAATLHVPLTDVTCSGATTGNLTGSQRIVQVSVPPQLDALKPTTTLVTVGIGGNDLDLFEAVLDQCLAGAPRCLQGVDVQRDIGIVQQRLTQVLHLIHQRSPAAKVVLIGYPQLIPADHTGCAGLSASPAVLEQVRGLIVDFGAMTARAARAGGATYVDLIGPSAGHDICSSSPWINGDQDSDQAIRFHPFVAEQEAVARLVEQAAARG